MTRAWRCTLQGHDRPHPNRPAQRALRAGTRSVALGDGLSRAWPAVSLPRDRGCRSRGCVACRWQLRQSRVEEPGVEEVVELLAADLFGKRDEVLGGCVAVVEASGPGTQD